MCEITTYYLEMSSSEQLKKKHISEGVTVTECEIKMHQLNRFLYGLVGADYHWDEKLSWSDQHWKSYVENGDLRTWNLYVKGTPAGYFELQMQKESNVEIAYFGMAPKFVGKGYGGHLLS